MKSGSRESKEAGTAEGVRRILARLESLGSARDREGMARFGIVSARAFGVSMPVLRDMARAHRRDHELALALWEAGWHETRLLACIVEDAAQVTPAQMDAWARDFDNWAVCDTACFQLFDRTPHAWGKARQWAKRRDEFTRRGAFAILAGLAVHAKRMADEPFIDALPLIEAAAGDGRNFVKKAVSWALREIGKRRFALHAPCVEVARRLAASTDPAARWVGRDALREFASEKIVARFGEQARPRNPVD